MDDNEEVVGSTLREELSRWASTFGITHNALDAGLKLLQQQGHEELPSTAGGFFDTSRKFKIKTVETNRQCG